ncbi:hypothetical protein KFE25_006283 [Diacronema lutheri]|uniref:Uncharacterized protein n=1 Tax=Diacronema lutheri TaxID=2081491 RepID=A0A8J5XQJ9_DIALT|nr:hypothetical protein KFE25_006283 [Diacronema lutheri]
MLPMQLAKSFAETTDCPVMSYLAGAQSLGLEGLWAKLCAGKLPARCSKQWYFETFCGVDAAEFAAKGHALLDGDANIREHLNGFVKPYDVVALMTILPLTRNAFPPCYVQPAAGGVHRLYLQPEHTIAVQHVLKLLRETYHEVALATMATGFARGGAGARTGAHGGPARTPAHRVATIGLKGGLTTSRTSKPAARGSRSALRISRGCFASGRTSRVHADNGAPVPAAGGSDEDFQIAPQDLSPRDRAGADALDRGGGGAFAHIARSTASSPSLGSRLAVLAGRLSGSTLNARREQGTSADGSRGCAALRTPQRGEGGGVSGRGDGDSSTAAVTAAADLRDEGVEGALRRKRVLATLRLALEEARVTHVRFSVPVMATASCVLITAFLANALDAEFTARQLRIPPAALTDQPGAQADAFAARACLWACLVAIAAPIVLLATHPMHLARTRAVTLVILVAGVLGIAQHAYRLAEVEALARGEQLDVWRVADSRAQRTAAFAGADATPAQLHTLKVAREIYYACVIVGLGVTVAWACVVGARSRQLPWRLVAVSWRVVGACFFTLGMARLGRILAWAALDLASTAERTAFRLAADSIAAVVQATVGSTMLCVSAQSCMLLLSRCVQQRAGAFAALAPLITSTEGKQAPMEHVAEAEASLRALTLTPAASVMISSDEWGVFTALHAAAARLGDSEAVALKGGRGAGGGGAGGGGAGGGGAAANGSAANGSAADGAAAGNEVIAFGRQPAASRRSSLIAIVKRANTVVKRVSSSSRTDDAANVEAPTAPCRESSKSMAVRATGVSRAATLLLGLRTMRTSAEEARDLMPKVSFESLADATAREGASAAGHALSSCTKGAYSGDDMCSSEGGGGGSFNWGAAARRKDAPQPQPHSNGKASLLSVAASASLGAARALSPSKRRRAQWGVAATMADGAAAAAGASDMAHTPDGHAPFAAAADADLASPDTRRPSYRVSSNGRHSLEILTSSASFHMLVASAAAQGGAGSARTYRSSCCEPPSSPTVVGALGTPTSRRFRPSERSASSRSAPTRYNVATAVATQAQPLVAHVSLVDYYVVHSWHDDPKAKQRALRRWLHTLGLRMADSERAPFEPANVSAAGGAPAGAHGNALDGESQCGPLRRARTAVQMIVAVPDDERDEHDERASHELPQQRHRPVTIWLDAACADPTLTPSQQLAHMPIYLSRSRKLLLLAGPTLVDRLWCVMELYAWRAVGGRLDDVVVAPVANELRDAHRLLASFDAFHVMYAKATRQDDARRIIHAVELATVSRFNDVVREYLPLVAAEVRRLVDEMTAADALAAEEALTLARLATDGSSTPRRTDGAGACGKGSVAIADGKATRDFRARRTTEARRPSGRGGLFGASGVGRLMRSPSVTRNVEHVFGGTCSRGSLPASLRDEGKEEKVTEAVLYSRRSDRR